VASLLVLWDVDFTLVSGAGAGWALYRQTFREMFAFEPPEHLPLHGRTDRAIAFELLKLAGVPQPDRRLAAFEAAFAANAWTVADRIREHGRVLPGADLALAALARYSDQHAAQAEAPAAGSPDGHSGPGGHPGPAAGPGYADGPGQPTAHPGQRPARVVQSVLTGNVRAMAEVKLTALGLAAYLDFDAGAYGDISEIRADLVPVARRNAAARYAADFSGAATVLIGDTPYDIEAALATGARAVGVASGSFDMPALAAAGAHHVLPDLTDTQRVLDAILAGEPRAHAGGAVAAPQAEPAPAPPVESAPAPPVESAPTPPIESAPAAEPAPAADGGPM
jgi:phosphoglycolate phosphatase-like HAD superfamily hydrolase